MNRFESIDDRDSALSPRLAHAVMLLRDEPEVPTPWRDDLVRRAAARHRRRRWARGGVALLAAGLCAAVVLGRGRGASRELDGRSLDDGAPVAAARPLGAAHVALVGDFDGWNKAGVPMSRARDGRTWTVDVRLPPGRHAFAFSVDGGLRVDPRAPRAGDDDFGTPSSVVVVPRAGTH